jgi:3-phosphoshikimate 1-carboxyvinyltransferase
MPAVRTIRPASAPLRGELEVPGDKSLAHRAVLFNGCARGRARITGLPDGHDVLSSVAAMTALGCVVEGPRDGVLEIEGRAMRLAAPGAVVDCGNSGTTIRLLMGLLSGQRFESVLDGDASLRRRPMERVAAPLRELGACVTTTDGRAPVRVLPAQLHPARVDTHVASAQVKSALLLAALSAAGTTTVVESVPTRDHSERMLAAMGIDVSRADGLVSIVGGVPTAIDVALCGDASSAAFFVVAATLVAGSDVTVRGVGLNPTRTGFLSVLERMGANVEVSSERDVAGEPVGDLRVRGAELVATEIGGAEIPACIDELPVLAVAASLARGRTRIRDAGELRVKESDRIATVAAMLAALGIAVEERVDGLDIEGGALAGGARVDAAGDHRIAMSAAVAALAAARPVEIGGADAASVSFPAFYQSLEALRTDATGAGPARAEKTQQGGD